MPISVEPGGTGFAEPEPIPQLPPSTITIKNGRVVKTMHWVLWNLHPWATIIVTRNTDGTFFSSISDPEHGGGNRTGSLDKCLAGLHPEVQSEYRDLFALNPATPEAISQIGRFGRYEIVHK